MPPLWLAADIGLSYASVLVGVMPMRIQKEGDNNKMNPLKRLLVWLLRPIIEEVVVELDQDDFFTHDPKDYEGRGDPD